MTLNRLLITSVVIENRPVRDVAAQYGVSESWLFELLARYRAEGEAAFEPRSRRPHSVPTTTPTETVDLIVELREKLTATGLDAGPDTIGWHLEHHHSTHGVPGHHRPLPDPGRPGRPGAEEEAQVLLHPLPGRDAQRDLAGRLHPLPAHPTRRPTRRRHRDPDLARRPLPLRPLGHRPPPGHRPDRAGHLPRNRCRARDPRLDADRQRHGLHHPPLPGKRAPAPATASRPSCAASASSRRTSRDPTTPPPAARSNASSRP